MPSTSIDQPEPTSGKQKPRPGHACGERNAKTRLTDEDVRAIRYLRVRGMRGPAIARLFGVDKSGVYKICKRTRWSYLDANLGVRAKVALVRASEKRHS